MLAGLIRFPSACQAFADRAVAEDKVLEALDGWYALRTHLGAQLHGQQPCPAPGQIVNA